MLNKFRFVPLLCAFSIAQGALTGVYHCHSEELAQLEIRHDEIESLAYFNYIPSTEKDALAPLDGSQAYFASRTAGFLNAHIEGEHQNIAIRFEAPNFRDSFCVPHSDDFGMPQILPPFCSEHNSTKKAAMSISDKEGQTLSYTEFSCRYEQ